MLRLEKIPIIKNRKRTAVENDEVIMFKIIAAKRIIKIFFSARRGKNPSLFHMFERIKIKSSVKTREAAAV